MKKLEVALRACLLWACLPGSVAFSQERRTFLSNGEGSAEIFSDAKHTGIVTVKLSKWPSSGGFSLAHEFFQLTAAYIGSPKVNLTWSETAMGTVLNLPKPSGHDLKVPDIILEIADSTTQFVSGRIVFSVNNRISHFPSPAEPSSMDEKFSLPRGVSMNPLDVADWNYKPTRWGMYDVELCYSASGPNQPEVKVNISGNQFTVKPISEGTYLYTVTNIGRIYLEKSEPFTVKVERGEQQEAGSLFVKALTLRPAPEGGPIIQAENGAFSLPASNAITHSVLMRYEPAKIKNCMGYWMNPADWAEWVFEVKKPGTFEIEVWQGCGKGSGGSDVYVEAGGKQYPFVVEDTGHFQNFVPRRIGQVTFDKAGEQSVAIHVKRQQKGAIMDIREVKLLPVEKR
jgi:hypothetical protein